MSIREDFELQELCVEEHQVREVLKCIIHTILFNRALGHVSPRDMDLELINATYPDVGDASINKRVEDGLRRVDQFLSGQLRQLLIGSGMRPAGDEGTPFVVKLSFYEAIMRPGIMKQYEEKVVWEIWRIHLRLVTAKQSKADRLLRQQALEDDMNHIRTTILLHADSKKDHMPPVRETGASGSSGPLTYPFEVMPERHAGLADSIIGTVSRMLARTSHSHPIPFR